LKNQKWFVKAEDIFPGKYFCFCFETTLCWIESVVPYQLAFPMPFSKKS